MIYNKLTITLGVLTIITCYIAMCSLAPQSSTDVLTEILTKEETTVMAHLEESIPNEATPPVIEPIELIFETPEKASNNAYFDVPLSTDIQDHIFELCKKTGIDASMVIAMIFVESTYNSSLIGDSGASLGLMQIQPRWHSDRMISLGCDDLLDPYQNIIVGVDYISELYTYGGKQRTTDWVLMAYNGGPAYANRKTANGEVTKYVNKVYNKQSNLTEV